MSYYDDYMDVGIRELKARLSEYVERVKAGEPVRVTERGLAVAMLVPLPAAANLERGIREGWIDPGDGSAFGPVTRFDPSRPVLEVLAEDRGE
ncbi:MAG: type II toxin-antitoxin system prevent-host-death family antitoxin [Actinomycetota bacterium]